MARKQKLKVYRTPVGFHDAYVAATSQKAALEAWGSDVDLFARGVAEIVTDEALTREALEKPGVVLRKPRGTSAEFVAALPKDRPTTRRRPSPVDEDEGPPSRHRPERAKPAPRSTGSRSRGAPRSTEQESKRRPRATPRPDRAKLDEAERAIERAEADHARRIADVREKEKRLQRERRELDKSYESDVDKLQRALAKARDGYAAALQKWRG